MTGPHRGLSLPETRTGAKPALTSSFVGLYQFLGRAPELSPHR